jgi:hypothetical protein
MVVLVTTIPPLVQREGETGTRSPHGEQHCVQALTELVALRTTDGNKNSWDRFL